MNKTAMAETSTDGDAGDELPPRAFAEHRRKKRSPHTMHYRVADCPHCHRPHSADALGIQLSQCIGEPRLYSVVVDDPTGRTPGNQPKE
jgi:hypothetical protein